MKMIQLKPLSVKVNVGSNLNLYSSFLRDSSGRLAYLDAIRGVAFLGMVVHHFIFFFYWHEVVFISPWSLPVQVIGWIVRVTFVLLVGVSSWLWFLKYWNGDVTQLVLSTTKRAAKVGFAAVLISLFTLVFVPEIPVYFGVLHMITYSIVFVVPFLFIPSFAWVVGTALILLARLHAVVEYDVGVYWLVSPSVRPPALDYFPVLPWFGVVLIGVSMGYFLRSRKIASVNHSTVIVSLVQNVSFPSRILAWFGRNALVLYVVHFPVVWLVTYTISAVL
jgi:uncharacterized membrane protein